MLATSRTPRVRYRFENRRRGRNISCRAHGFGGRGILQQNSRRYATSLSTDEQPHAGLETKTGPFRRPLFWFATQDANRHCSVSPTRSFSREFRQSPERGRHRVWRAGMFPLLRPRRWFAHGGFPDRMDGRDVIAIEHHHDTSSACRCEGEMGREAVVAAAVHHDLFAIRVGEDPAYPRMPFAFGYGGPMFPQHIVRRRLQYAPSSSPRLMLISIHRTMSSTFECKFELGVCARL